MLEDSKELCERGRIPRNQQQLSNAAPGKLGEETIEEDVRNIFLSVAHDAVSIRLVVASLDLGIRR
jgi:hypothetical protein